MSERSLRERLAALPGVALSNVPVAVVAVGLVAWLLASNGVYARRDVGVGVVFNPFSYLTSMVLHADWGHFAGNVRLWLPVGVVFTWLTSNRHVLVVAVVAHVATQVISSGLLRFGAGLSVAVFAVLTAALVRSIGVAFRNRSAAALRTALAALLVPVLVAVYLLVLLAGPSQVGHLEHFFGALFGAAIETMYVLRAHDEATDERATGRALR